MWSVETGQLLLSHQVTYDTLFGGSFSPDGRLFAFGATDNVVRAIDTETGEQQLHQGAHEDWALATVFNPSVTHLISGGRDMTVKLTEVATERFVDNVTSITPGALKGGVHALAMHPTLDQVLVGGADGSPKIYRIFRETARRIGDDANLIRKFPQQVGRIFGLALSADGQQFAVASTLDGHSQVRVYPYQFAGEVPAEVQAALAKAADQRDDADKELINKFYSQTSDPTVSLNIPDSIYAVALHPQRDLLAVGGAAGRFACTPRPAASCWMSWCQCRLPWRPTSGKWVRKRLCWQGMGCCCQRMLGPIGRKSSDCCPRAAAGDYR